MPPRPSTCTTCDRVMGRCHRASSDRREPREWKPRRPRQRACTEQHSNSLTDRALGASILPLLAAPLKSNQNITAVPIIEPKIARTIGVIGHNDRRSWRLPQAATLVATFSIVSARCCASVILPGRCSGTRPTKRLPGNAEKCSFPNAA